MACSPVFTPAKARRKMGKVGFEQAHILNTSGIKIELMAQTAATIL